jgi:isopenicillin N synthase-like dioxygenase
LPDQERAGAHTDYGSLTILLPDPEIGGLEVKYKNGKWLPINPEENTFIINIGDMMARWTNDRWVSTLHRVTTPNKIERTLTDKRQSIAYFQNPNFDAAIKCLPTCIQSDNQAKYQTIMAGKYLMNRFKATMKK